MSSGFESVRSGDDLHKDTKESQLWHSKAGPDAVSGAPNTEKACS